MLLLALLATSASDNYARAFAAFGDAGHRLTHLQPSGVSPTVGLVVVAAVLLFGFTRERGASSGSRSSGAGSLLLPIGIVAVCAVLFLNGGLS